MSGVGKKEIARHLAQAEKVSDEDKIVLDLADVPGVVLTPTGRPRWCMATAVAVMTHYPSWRGVLRRDHFANRDFLFKPIPGSAETKSFQCREVQDTDFTGAMVWFNRNGLPSANKAIIMDAFDAVARNNGFDPLCEYLNGLVWDGQPRLGSWLTTYMGAQDNIYTCEVGQRFMIAAVARAFRPGCKVDTCLVLEGGQGSGKSSALRVLAGRDWFGDALPELKSKDASSYLSGRWIVEIAELTPLRSSDAEMIKAFISRQEEQYRPAYGRKEVREPRRCVFVGTTNRDDYLHDPTGNRRFLPVQTGEVDLARLQMDRDQLWAEAVHLFNAGKHWWLTGEAEELATKEQASRGDDDPWTAQILAYCQDKESVACKVILEEVFGIFGERLTKKETNRVSNILRQIGFRRDKQFTSGVAKGLAKYVRLQDQSGT